MDMMWYRRRGLMVTPHIESASGSIASFNSGYNKIPVKSLICNIEPIQAGSGDPSPENVRPISGRTGLSVVRSGKNLLKTAGLIEGTPSNTEFSNATKRTFTVGTFVTKLTNNNYYQSNVNIQFSVSENSIKVTSSARAYAISIPIVGLKIGETYVLSCTKTNAGNNTASFYKQDGTFISNTQSLTICKFTVPEETYYTLLHFTPSDSNVEATYTDIQLELGSTATDYEPYKGNTYSVNWETEAGTVYGGYVDTVSGKLTVDRAKRVFDGSEPWAAYPSFEGYLLWIATMKPGLRQSGHSNMLKLSTSTDSGQKNTFWLGVNTKYIYVLGVYESMGSTVENFKTYLSTHNLEIEYPLATPIEIQLSGQEIRTLLGANNIWCDSGDVTVDYWKWGK